MGFDVNTNQNNDDNDKFEARVEHKNASIKETKEVLNMELTENIFNSEANVESMNVTTATRNLDLIESEATQDNLGSFNAVNQKVEIDDGIFGDSLLNAS